VAAVGFTAVAVAAAPKPSLPKVRVPKVMRGPGKPKGTVTPVKPAKAGSAAPRKPRAAKATPKARPSATPKRAGVEGLTADGRTQSKAQQKMSFATRKSWAHSAARSGAAYKSLPEHKK
jgi:hypothetical protein